MRANLKLLATGFTLALVLTNLTGVGAQAEYGCVTKAEYRAIKFGMTRARVHSILGTSGRLIAWTKMGGYKIEGRTYSTCSPYDVGVVSLNFENKKLTIKTAAFVK